MSAVIDGSGQPQMEKSEASSTQAAITVPATAEAKGPNAMARLEASRAQLRLAMTPHSRAGGAKSGPAPGVKAAIDVVRTLPGASLLVDTVTHWWAKHPLRDASVIAREASGAILSPIARDNPVKLIFGALLVGAVLMLLKPWRFLLRSALFAGLVPQLAAMALKRVPLGTWLKLFLKREKRATVSAPASAIPATGSLRRVK